MIGVSSFGPRAVYQKKFLEQLDKWPGKMILYLESPIDFEHEKLEKRSLFDIPGFIPFIHYLDKFPQAKGKMPYGYDYNFDIWKFCRKMFCQFDAFQKGGKIFWVDADMEFFKPIPEDYLENLFRGEPLVYLGREGFYTESGFVGFDTDHPDFKIFEQRYRDTLRTGIVFTLKGWHDCYCFDYAKQSGRNLSPNWKKGDDLNVLCSTELIEFMFHNKGNLKYV